MASAIDAQIAQVLPRIEAIAARFTRRRGAELDDLVQEGMIAAWLALERGEEPSDRVIENRIRAWCQRMRRQTRNQLPLEEADDLNDPYASG